MSDVSKSVSNTARFGKVINYQIRLDGVTFSAERMVGASEDYTVSSHVGRCGHSFHHPKDADGKLVRVTGGTNIAKRFEALARELRKDPANFTHAHNLCTDKEACGRFVIEPEEYVPNPNPDADGDDFDEDDEALTLECGHCGNDFDAVTGMDATGSRRCDDTDPEHLRHAPADEDEEVDVASLPDCGEDFMAGTICSLAEGHVERDGTSHAAECRVCGVDWINNDGCDCPPKDDELPGVPLDGDGAPINGFEVMAVRYRELDTIPCSAEEADAWGVYVTYDDAPSMHVEDYDTQKKAERIAEALAGKHDVEAITLPSGGPTISDDEPDTSSSGSVQHFIETGRYMTVKQVREQKEADDAAAREAYAQALQAKDGMIGMSDQPTTCGKCGSRTEYEDLADSIDGETRQLHICRRCGHQFVVESDREWDEHDEAHVEGYPSSGCTYCSPTRPEEPDTLTRLRAQVENDYEGDVLATLIDRAGFHLTPTA